MDCVVHGAAKSQTWLRDFHCCCKSLQSCLTLYDPMDCSLPGSSVHGILQSRILEWVAISFSRGSSQPRDWTSISYVSCIGRGVLYCYHHLGNPWRILSMVLTSMWNESTCMVVWMSFSIALLWDWNEDQSFSVPWPLLSFQTLLTYECSTLTASYFRILSSSAGILSPALALFIVMLPKVHLTSHISLCILCIKKQSILFYTLK